MRWPLGRPTTVRTRIVALALAPAVALMALWSFAMVSVTSELRALIRLQGVYEDFGTPVDTAIGQIQIERRMSAAYLGARLDTATAGQLLEQQRRTDRAVDAMRQAIRDGDRGRLTARQRQALDTMDAAAGKLDGLRSQVLSRHISWDRAVGEYSALVEPGFDVQSTLTALQAGQLAREAQVVSELVRVREFVSREDALVAGARAAGTLTDGQYDTLTATIEDRRVFQRTYVPDLPADSRALFEGFQRGALYGSLVRGEDALLRAGATGAGRAVAADTWRSTTDRAVKRYMQLCTQSAENSAARGRAFAYRELTKSAVVGVTGLAAVGLSLWFAVRGARRISRRLETLRDAADVLTQHQLPDVMRRLSAGEEVDAVAEAPPLAADEVRDDEIGQVGRSFNTARLAAVEAAVKQATLRRGLFAVLLNIARRNQALVHRQLKLVDTLERRTEDPDVLRELFRIDHLTTRMRRHAESLIILSGSAPGRRWRRPVPVANVVASAVGEIEDYARVVVPPMPEIGVAADAVADVVHLVAELLENATVFSPPHTQVTLRTGRVGSGFVIEIDDRGLGLDAEARTHARATLTDPDAFDPTRHDRLGLYVVGRLAAHHGIEVSLGDSPYGGTTAVILLPEKVLAETGPAGPADPVEPVAAGRSGVRQTGEPEDARPGTGAPEDRTLPGHGHTDGLATVRELPPRGRPAVGPGAGDLPSEGRSGVSAGVGELPSRRRPAVGPGAGDVPSGGPSGVSVGVGEAPSIGRSEASSDVAELPSGKRAGSAPGAGAPPARRRPGARPSGDPGSAVAPEPSAGQEPAHTSAPAPEAPALPTRVRQASLARELREDPPTPDTAPGREVDAEEMRAIFGAFQRGLDRGRKGLPATDATARSSGTAKPTERQLPRGAGNGATSPHAPAPEHAPAPAPAPEHAPAPAPAPEHAPAPAPAPAPKHAPAPAPAPEHAPAPGPDHAPAPDHAPPVPALAPDQAHAHEPAPHHADNAPTDATPAPLTSHADEGTDTDHER
ncbi:sensor histidine kinase [Streptomyces barringtoniae]|uniref:sensor histidine kinase n=1 Tax=Streptomyces barringtoniae TaxID=2892029 RepID=UPI001E301AE8|nr:nitrate- and nitrite sensing domain-containing protein [Streptomyces barringtoniae]MCC5475296.1 nitrate- and nitrite sensing domain-containing protein [Streptomyces barringtoniae]